MLSRLYGALAGYRRRWYAARPDRRRRLERPVISVGALAVGGSGKTPVTAHLGRLLAVMGERPAILSRGYARQRRVDGVVVVSDRGTLKAGVETAGDEPSMLARQLDGVSVVVAEDRYLAGRLAETQLAATVHVLDDGFQHLGLERDCDILLLGPRDLDDARTLPGGHLRESPAAAACADVALVETDDPEQARDVGRRIGLTDVFRFTRQMQTPVDAATAREMPLAHGSRVVALAGIARPQAFAEALEAAGYDVVDMKRAADHQVYSRTDIADVQARFRARGADAVVTTEKDFERLRRHAPFPFPLLAIPLRVSVQPAEEFRARLARTLATRASAQPTGGAA